MTYQKQNKPMLPRRLQRCWGRNYSPILAWFQSLKHTGIFSEIRPTPGWLKRPKVEISWDFLLTSESLRRTMEKWQFGQLPQTLLGLKLPPRTEWPHVASLSLYTCWSSETVGVLRLHHDQPEDSHSGGLRSSRRFPATWHSKHRHSKLSPCTQTLQTPSHTQLSLCPEVPVVPKEGEENAEAVGYIVWKVLNAVVTSTGIKT